MLQTMPSDNQLERAVAERTEELRRSNAELQEFAAIASHDLQEPLRKIRAFGDRLRAHCVHVLDSEWLDLLDRMQAAAVRMQTLIENLLAYARVTTKAQPFEAVDLGEVLRAVLGDLEVRREEAGATVAVGELPTIDADRVQMHQLLLNVAGNALKFRRPDVVPRVTIRGEVHDTTCHVLIEDNGIGFEEQYRERIFAPFQRLHARGAYEGTGMGLAICRKIVERHGGRITAKSMRGQGSTFIITLPIRQPKEPVHDTQTDHDPHGRRRRGRPPDDAGGAAREPLGQRFAVR